MGRYMPGKPIVVLQNMPGAGSLVSANHIYNAAAKDGTVLATFSRGNAMYPLLEGATQFDPQKFNWIGSPAKEVSLTLSWHTSKFKTLADLRGSEMVVGATGAGADSVVLANTLNAILGTKLRIVSGYPGNQDVLLAMERGEVSGSGSMSYGTVKSFRPYWIPENKLNFILQQALEPHATEFKGVPMLQQHASTPLDKQALDLLLSRQTIAYPITAPPGVPADRVAVLRTAFDATAKDAEFLAEAAKINLEIDPVGGARIAEIVAMVYATPKEAVERAKAAISGGAKK